MRDLVGEVAEQPAWFTFLAEARAETSVRIGDGRLLVDDETDDSIDMAIMDAFSSDSVPAHLVTVEGLEGMDRILREDGILAVHVSNRYYDLARPVAAALHAQGLAVLERSFGPTPAQVAAGGAPTRLLIGTRSDDVIAGLEALVWTLADTDAVPLTDDFPDLLRYLRLSGF